MVEEAAEEEEGDGQRLLLFQTRRVGNAHFGEMKSTGDQPKHVERGN